MMIILLRVYEIFWCANELNQALRPEMIVMVTRHRSVFKVYCE